MNKQEAIKRVEQSGEYEHFIAKKSALDIISKIHEPQKVVVPKFVADWYEEIKGNFYLNLHYRAWDMFESLDENSCVPEKPLADDFTRWYYNTKNAIQTLVNMHQFGYDVEKEPLYTVEIPNPESDSLTVLEKLDDGTVIISQMDDFPVDWRNHAWYQLTEQEIRKNFEWAWQFAKPVEEE